MNFRSAGGFGDEKPGRERQVKGMDVMSFVLVAARAPGVVPNVPVDLGRCMKAAISLRRVSAEQQ